MLEEERPPVSDTIFTVRNIVDGLDALIEGGTLAAEHIWDAWRRDRALKNRGQLIRDTPSELNDELQRRMTDNGAPSALIKWSPRYGIRLPYVVAWLTDPHIEDRRQMFEALDMDRAQFVRELLDDPFFGVRVRYEVVEDPYLLTFLPEEERWVRLEAAVREHATVIEWHWPRYTAKSWSKDRTIELIRKLIKEPELASSFLVGKGAPGNAWRLFWDSEAFVYILREAGRVAPYEFALVHQWIATCIGDRVVNQLGSSFMDEPEGEDTEYRWGGWWMAPESVHKEFGPKGERLMVKIIDEVLSGTLEADESNLSGVSQFFVRQIKASVAEIAPKTARDLAQLLVELPECNFSSNLIGQLIEGCKCDYLDQAYRWMLSIRQRFDLTRFHVLVRIGEWRDAAAFQKITWGEKLVKESWLSRALRSGMEAKGWKFCMTEWHENSKKGRSDLQVRSWSGGVTSVYGIWWPSNNGWGDYVPQYPRTAPPPVFEAMIPPGFNPGEVKYRSREDNFRIYHVGSSLMLSRPWSYEYLSKHGG